MRQWWLAAIVWTLVLALALTGVGYTVESKGLDLLALLDPFVPADPRIVVVGIDDHSFQALEERGMRWPWPRDVHAQLIDRLAEAGVSVIGFDVLFVDQSAPAADARLADAIRRFPRIVLAADRQFFEDERAEVTKGLEPLALLREAGAVPGQVRVSLDDDQVIRRLPADRHAFARVVAALDASRRGVTLSPAPDRAETYIRWTAGAEPFAYASYDQAIGAGPALPPGFFRDRIVLVGFNVPGSTEPQVKRADVWATPLFPLTGRLTPGVEVQAQALNTLLQGRALAGAPLPARLAVIAVVAGLSALLLRPWRPLVSAVRALGLVAALLGVSWIGYRYLDVWMPVVVIVGGVALTYAGGGGLAYLEERALRRRMRDAFGRYVSPALVEQIIANPNRLRLGGERKEVTVIFTDLAGFTTIAERLAPEEVVRVLNDYLTAVAGIVIKTDGTVVKFLGDGMMALWGAPVDNPEHAPAACRAVVQMQEAVATLATTLTGGGGPTLRMRVGVHTGEVIVGNMGTAERFDYTATGDTVNLASRLEGANKVYGTTTLVSEATTRLAGRAVGFRPVDLLRVKGKSEAIEVFTPERDAELIATTAAAIEAYRKQDWSVAEAHWRQALARRAGDPLAGYYLTRIAALRALPPPPDWDGSLTLDVK